MRAPDPESVPATTLGRARPAGNRLYVAEDRSSEDERIWRSFEAHSRTFSLAARLLPSSVRTPIAIVYLFCRTVDNVADERVRVVGAREAMRELLELKSRLQAALSGHRPNEMLWRRLAEVHARFRLHPEPFMELIEGAAWDLEGRTIRDEADLLAYSNLVGGSIGAMMLPFLTHREATYPDLEPGARALGTAMQITNIIRDVGEDHATLGRLYVPESLMEEFGFTSEMLRRPEIPDGYAHLIERLTALSERHYDRGMAKIGALPLNVRLGIRGAARMYREIMNEVRARGYDNIRQRAILTPRRKLTVLLFDGYARRKARLVTGGSMALPDQPVQSA